jgi:hypothetical protein
MLPQHTIVKLAHHAQHSKTIPLCKLKWLRPSSQESGDSLTHFLQIFNISSKSS